MYSDVPRTIYPANTFNTLVQWFHKEMILKQGAPGFLVGLSGTDSIVAFMAAYKAFEEAGHPERVLGIHFAPSEDFLYDHPEADVHLWFSKEVVPWLHQEAKGAKVIVDTSIDWRCDGQRWGALMDLSIVSTERQRQMRLPEEQYWVVGTRNRSEDTLLNYSNASTAASLQPLIHLWKSEILKISEYLGAPKIALAKSCETDCICGRLRLPSQHIREVDMLLMARGGELSWEYVEKNIPLDLQKQLTGFIRDQIAKTSFKKNIPYSPDPLVMAFENGSLNLKEFNHYKHLYVAWYYLRTLPSLGVAVERYGKYLLPLLESAGQSHRFSWETTAKYFAKLEGAMKLYPTDNFDELMVKAQDLLKKQ
jgi:NH3-dependent NAD+ synthetase